MPSTANLAIYQGDDYSAVVNVSDGSATGPDLSTYTAQAQIRNGPADTNPTIIFEIPTAIVAGAPQITLSISRNVTVTLSGSYSWDLQLTAADGTITTILAGKVTVTPEITREA